MARIAFFLPNLQPGGAERVSINLANALRDAGHAVDLVLLQAQGDLLKTLSPRLSVLDLKVTRLRNGTLPLARYLRRSRPDALLACMWPLTVMAVWARWLSRTRTPLVLSEHTTWSRADLVSNSRTRWTVRTSMRLFFPFAERIVAVSEGAARDLERFAGLPGGSVEAVFNPIVSSVHGRRTPPPATPEAWCEGPHRRILAVGTLKPEKSYHTLVEALSRISPASDVRLLILGEGTCRADLHAQIVRLGLSGKVFMPGYVRDPAPYFQHAELVVLSSEAEGLPTVLVEALAAGTPVVSTNCESGPREILCDGRYGRLVPVGDASALAEAIEQALRTPPDRATLIRRSQDFSVDAAARRYLELFGLGAASAAMPTRLRAQGGQST